MINRVISCFHQEKTNIGRQAELDLARGFSVICMVLTHTYGYVSSWNDTWAKSIYNYAFGGPFAAAVFMFIMGMNLCYSRKHTPGDYLVRGLHLLGLGFLLSFLRQLLPDLIYYHAEGTSSLTEELPTLLLYMVAEVDILQFAGIFHIVFALLKKAEFSFRQVGVLSVAFLLIGFSFRYFSTESKLVNILLGFWIPSHDRVWFPFLNWFIIPVSGYFFGRLWLHCRDKETFYRFITLPCWILAIVFLKISHGYHYLDHYYALGPIEALFALITVFAMLGTGHFVGRYCKILSRMMCWLSRELTAIYWTHWVLIANLYTMITCYIGDELFPLADLWIAPAGLLILLLTCFLVAVFRSVVRKKHIVSSFS